MDFSSKKLSRLTIIKQYYFAHKANIINYDKQQIKILKQFEDFNQNLKKLTFLRKNDISGIYIYGNVGRGKTYLSSILYDNIYLNPKLHIHLHEFMHKIHDKINFFRNNSHNHHDPVIAAAFDFAKKYKFIFFDEFIVHDTADSLIMDKLFTTLIKLKIKFIMTSNFPPNELYKDGIQRQQFQKFINLIEKKFKIINLDAKVDYRKIKIKSLDKTYLFPINGKNKIKFDNIFHDLTANSLTSDRILKNKSREIFIPISASKTAMFEFEDLCLQALNTKDFQIIADNYTTIFIKNIRQINNEENEIARRFINLIDIFYNNKTNIIFLAKIAETEIYLGKKLAFEFKRCVSRIKEMQTKSYQTSEIK